MCVNYYFVQLLKLTKDNCALVESGMKNPVLLYFDRQQWTLEKESAEKLKSYSQQQSKRASTAEVSKIPEVFWLIQLTGSK